MANKHTLRQPLSDELKEIAKRMENGDEKNLKGLSAQLSKGEIDEAILLKLTSKRKELEGRPPKVLEKFDNLVAAIQASIRGKVFGASDSHSTVQTRVPHALPDADETRGFHRIFPLPNSTPPENAPDTGEGTLEFNRPLTLPQSSPLPRPEMPHQLTVIMHRGGNKENPESTSSSQQSVDPGMLDILRGKLESTDKIREYISKRFESNNPVKIGSRVLTRVLGHGGMGIVFEARNEELKGRYEAVKIVLPEQGDEITHNKLKKEAGNAAQVVNQYVVIVYDVGRIPLNDSGDYCPIVFSQFIDGNDAHAALFSTKSGLLKKLKSKEKPVAGLSKKAALLFMREILKGVKSIHEKGLVHLDLKFENVMIIKEVLNNLKKPPLTLPKIENIFETAAPGWAKVTDLGLSSNEGEIIGLEGTPRYMPPEIYSKAESGELKAHPSADICILGLMLYEALTLQPSAGAIDHSYVNFSKSKILEIKRKMSELEKKKDTEKNGEEIAALTTELQNLEFLFKSHSKLTPSSHLYSFASVAMNMTEGSLIRADDPMLLGTHNNDRALIDLLVRMTAIDPLKRPDINEVLRVVETKLKKMNEKLWPKLVAAFGGVLIVSLIGLLAKSSTESAQNFLNEHAQRMKNIEEKTSSNNWEMVIQLLNSEIEIMEANENLDAEEKAEKVGNLRERLSRARTAHSQLLEQARLEREELERQRQARVEANAMAERLIVEGDELANRADFTGAIEKYNKAASVSAEQRSLTNEKIAVARFRSGVRAYRSGDLENFTSYLPQAREQNYAGLSEEQKNVLIQLAGRVENWDSVEQQLRKDALHKLGFTTNRENGHIKIYSTTNIPVDTWNASAEELFRDARNGEENAMYRLMCVMSFLAKYLDPNFRGNNDAQIAAVQQQRFVDFSGQLLLHMPKLENRLDENPGLNILTQRELVTISNVLNGSTTDFLGQLSPLTSRIRELRSLPENQRQEIDRLLPQAERIGKGIMETSCRLVQAIASIERISAAPDANILPAETRARLLSTVQQKYLEANAQLGRVSEEMQSQFNQRIGDPLFLREMRGN